MNAYKTKRETASFYKTELRLLPMTDIQVAHLKDRLGRNSLGE